MEFRLLGSVEAVRGDHALPVGGPKARALLALLLLHANEVVSRDRLLEALWSGRAPGSTEHSLDVQVSRLRKAFACASPRMPSSAASRSAPRPAASLRSPAFSRRCRP